MPLLSIYLVYRKFYKFVYIGISITKIIPVGIVDRVVVVDVATRHHTPCTADEAEVRVRRDLYAPAGIGDKVVVADSTRRGHDPRDVADVEARVRRS